MSIKIQLGIVVLIVMIVGLAWWALQPVAAAVPPGFVAVTKVADGDTFEVRQDGRTERVRLIGVDTPETVDPRRPVQCFGKEASHYTKQLLRGQVVRLERDALRPGDDRDKYQRLLRYAFLSDGRMVNQLLIGGGYAHEYTYHGQAYQYQAEFKAAEASAKAAGTGLWSPATCGGDTKQSAA